jgi:hypothetical protein
MSSKEFSNKTFKWLYQINSDFELPPIDMKVAVQLTVHFNEENDGGRAYPGLKFMGDAIGVSEPTMVRSIHRLERRGHLHVVWGSAGRGHSNQYWMIVKPVSKKPPRVKVSDPHKTSTGKSENLHSCSVKPPRMDMNHLITTGGTTRERAAPQAGVVTSASTTGPPDAVAVGKPDPETVAIGFAEFWQECPKKVGKHGAEAAYRKALEGGATVEQINTAIKHYAAAQIGKAERWIMHPKRWLEEGHYLNAVGGKPTLDQHGNLIATARSYSNSGGSWAEDVELLRAHIHAGTFGNFGRPQ